MNYSVTQRNDWLPAVARTYRFFQGREYNNEPLEERIVFYCQMLENFNLLQSGKRIMDLGAGIYWFNPLVASMGPKMILVDDYGGGWRD